MTIHQCNECAKENDHEEIAACEVCTKDARPKTCNVCGISRLHFPNDVMSPITVIKTDDGDQYVCDACVFAEVMDEYEKSHAYSNEQFMSQI